MDRYLNSKTLRTEEGKRYKSITRYPKIPLSESDIYIYTDEGDRFDTLAQEYYKDSRLWWVISIANETLEQNSYYPPTGMQVRIPQNISSIMSEFEELNKR